MSVSSKSLNFIANLLERKPIKRSQRWKLFSGLFINIVHLAHVPIIAEQNDMQLVLYLLSALAGPSTDRQTLIIFRWILEPRKKLSLKSVLPWPRRLSKQLEKV